MQVSTIFFRFSPCLKIWDPYCIPKTFSMENVFSQCHTPFFALLNHVLIMMDVLNNFLVPISLDYMRSTIVYSNSLPVFKKTNKKLECLISTYTRQHVT